jgi:hypothetical protein
MTPPSIARRHAVNATPPAMQCEVATIEDTVLALLGGFDFDNGRAWKRSDFDGHRLWVVQGPTRQRERPFSLRQIERPLTGAAPSSRT